MPVYRHYHMQATDGAADALKAELLVLADRVTPVHGCEGVELMIDPHDPHVCIFIETWTSVDDHKTAGAALGRQAFAPVMALLARPPKGRYLERAALRDRSRAIPVIGEAD